MATDNGDEDVLDLLKDMEYKAALSPQPDDIQPAVNTVATTLLDDTAEVAYVYCCAKNIVSYSLLGILPDDNSFSEDQDAVRCVHFDRCQYPNEDQLR